MKLYEMLLDALMRVVMYIVVYFGIALCWVGAEYLFEGAVHSSEIDGLVLCYLTYYVVRDLLRLQDELVDRRSDHDKT